ncbi:MAG: FAD:protein FMN transferase [Desulfosarcinaceae bacterium]|nr:FAD:protein FMN transferase [Desulfosarcinaceae bacterium]
MHAFATFLISKGVSVARPIAALFLVLLAGCGQVETTITGQTMGTTYMVKVIGHRLAKTRHLKPLIEARLEAVTASMSTYRPESEISRFNAIDRVGEPFSPSLDFLTVMRVAARIHALTGGAWDGTLDPLITLWGFGRDQQRNRVPTAAEVDALLPRVGFHRIAITATGQLTKLDGRVTLDLASIAKGYGVDVLAHLLASKGYSDFLVEVGGEVYAAGRRHDGHPWRVGINRPDPSAGFSEVFMVVALGDQAFATSGDYRNYFEIDGRTYPHILDPRTGRPVSNGVVSASVLADTCTLADGLATALIVMGPAAGLALVERLPTVEALIIVRSVDGSLSLHPSSGFIATRHTN